METWMWIAIGAAAVLVALAMLLLAGARRSRRARSDLLRRRFGSEYDRAVTDHGDRASAERDLADRLRRHSDLELTELSPAARERYLAAWAEVQAHFVDDPAGATLEADRLVRRVLADIGYAADADDADGIRLVAVDEPEVVTRYRHGHDLVERRDGGAAATEQLREAMVDFRDAFEELLADRRAA